jgi:hypothetical protein
VLSHLNPGWLLRLAHAVWQVAPIATLPRVVLVRDADSRESERVVRADQRNQVASTRRLRTERAATRSMDGIA